MCMSEIKDIIKNEYLEYMNNILNIFPKDFTIDLNNLFSDRYFINDLTKPVGNLNFQSNNIYDRIREQKECYLLGMFNHLYQNNSFSIEDKALLLLSGVAFLKADQDQYYKLYYIYKTHIAHMYNLLYLLYCDKNELYVKLYQHSEFQTIMDNDYRIIMAKLPEIFNNNPHELTYEYSKYIAFELKNFKYINHLESFLEFHKAKIIYSRDCFLAVRREIANMRIENFIFTPLELTIKEDYMYRLNILENIIQSYYNYSISKN